MGRPRTHAQIRCPVRGHNRSHVVRWGSWVAADGFTRAKYRCTPIGAAVHFFSTLVDPGGTPTVAVVSTPPSCPDPDHTGSRILRDGTYARGGASPRQRYVCEPQRPEGWERPEGWDPDLFSWRSKSDPFARHRFTPSLARAHVHRGVETCEVCSGVTDVHQGRSVVARRHRWNLEVVGQALIELAKGASYAEVSRWARTQVEPEDEEPRWPTVDAFGEPPETDDATPDETGDDRGKLLRLRPATSADVGGEAELAGDAWASGSSLRYVVVSRSTPGPADGPEPGREKNPKSAIAHNVWHQSADWCEVFSPVLWQPWHERAVTEAQARRAVLDGLREQGTPLDLPQVLLLDEVPVYDSSRVTGGEPNYRFRILIAAEVLWREDKRKKVYRDIRLRLVRALPTNDNWAWKLVLDELGYVPDYVVSDGGTGINAALGTHLGSQTVLIPSQFHVHTTVHEALVHTPGAWEKTGNAARKPIDELQGYLDELHKGGHPYTSAEAWQLWWDELYARMNELGLPLDRIEYRRRNYEQPYLDALPHLLANPRLPVTTGGLETLIKRRIKPVLTGRTHGFTNIERTNRLLDLVTLYDNNQLRNAHHVAARLRADNEATFGWAAPVRLVNDPSGSTPDNRYKSLLDQTLPKTLVASRTTP